MPRGRLGGFAVKLLNLSTLTTVWVCVRVRVHKSNGALVVNMTMVRKMVGYET